MSWSGLPAPQDDLTTALSTYDWETAKQVCDRLIREIQHEPTPCPTKEAREILTALRKKRRFELIVSVAEALVMFGQNAPRVRRQYAQALIDQGLLVVPESILQTLASEPLEDDSQFAEAHGLLGRIYKQRSVNADHRRRRLRDATSVHRPAVQRQGRHRFRCRREAADPAGPRERGGRGCDHS